jgi:hypothetical protein
MATRETRLNLQEEDKIEGFSNTDDLPAGSSPLKLFAIDSRTGLLSNPLYIPTSGQVRGPGPILFAVLSSSRPRTPPTTQEESPYTTYPDTNRQTPKKPGAWMHTH